MDRTVLNRPKSKATPAISRYMFAIIFVLFVQLDVSVTSSENQVWLDHARRINLQNINGLSPPSKMDQGYSTRKDEKPKEMIEQASHDLSTRLRLLSNSEIGITNMQVNNFASNSKSKYRSNLDLDLDSRVLPQTRGRAN